MLITPTVRKKVNSVVHERIQMESAVKKTRKSSVSRLILNEDKTIGTELYLGLSEFYNYSPLRIPKSIDRKNKKPQLDRLAA